jgi:hypothetical protein
MASYAMLPTQISDIKMDGLKKQPVIRQNAANLLDFRIAIENYTICYNHPVSGIYRGIARMNLQPVITLVNNRAGRLTYAN